MSDTKLNLPAVWGSRTGQAVTCQYNVTTSSGSFGATASFSVDNGEVTASCPSAQAVRACDAGLQNFNGSASSVCASFRSGERLYTLTEVSVEDQSTGLYGIRPITLLAFGVSLSLIMAYIVWRHVSKGVARVGDETDEDDPIEYYTTSDGRERFRMKGTHRWRMDQ